MRYPIPYTKTDLEELTPLQSFIHVNHEYYTIAEIANELNYTYDKVLYAYHAVGITPLSPLEVLLNNIKDRPKETIQELAIRYNREYSYINRLVKKNGLPNPTMAVRGRPQKYV